MNLLADMNKRFIEGARWTMLLLCYVCTLIVISSCQKEENNTPVVELVAPRFETMDVGQISAKEAVLRGKVLEVLNEDILEVGFIFLERSSLGIHEREIELDFQEAGAEISYRYVPQHAFVLGESYRYCMYVRTEKNFYKGDFKTFIFDGLQINQTDVIKIVPGEDVVLGGDFSMLDASYRIMLADGASSRPIAYVLDEGRKTLRFTLPMDVRAVHGDHLSMSLSIFRTGGTVSSRYICTVGVLGKVIPPQRTDYRVNEVISLHGIALPNDAAVPADLKLLVNGRSYPYRSVLPISAVLDQLKGNNFSFGFSNGRDSVVFEQQMTIDMPDISMLRYTQEFFHPGLTFSTLHFNFYDYFGNSGEYRLGDRTISPANFHFGNNNFLLGDAPEGSYIFTVKSSLYSLQAPMPVVVKKLTWGIAGAGIRRVGDPLVLEGTFLPGFEYIVKLDGVVDNHYYSAQQGKLQFAVTPNFIGRKELEVGYYDFSGNFVSDGGKHMIETEAFVLESVSPLQGYPGEVVTLKGKGIRFAERVLFGNHLVIPMVLDDNTIQAAAPRVALPGQVRISLSMYGELYQYPSYFEYL